MKRILIHRRYGNQGDFTDTIQVNDGDRVLCPLKTPTHFIEVWRNKNGYEQDEKPLKLEHAKTFYSFAPKGITPIAIFKIRAK